MAWALGRGQRPVRRSVRSLCFLLLCLCSSAFILLLSEVVCPCSLQLPASPDPDGVSPAPGTRELFLDTFHVPGEGSGAHPSSLGTVLRLQNDCLCPVGMDQLLSKGLLRNRHVLSRMSTTWIPLRCIPQSLSSGFLVAVTRGARELIAEPKVRQVHPSRI